jgi:ketosteroid isomerase-like protein
VGEWFGDWFRSFDQDYRFEIEDTRPVGEQVVVVARHHGHGRASGVALDWIVVYVYTVQAGRIVRVELFSDLAEALKAVGLEE